MLGPKCGVVGTWEMNFCGALICVCTKHFPACESFSSAIRGKQPICILILHIASALSCSVFVAAMSLRAGARLVSRPASPSIAGINVIFLPFQVLLHVLTHRRHTGNSGPRPQPRQSPTKHLIVVAHRLFPQSTRRPGQPPRPSQISCTTPLNRLARLPSVMC